MSSLSAFVGSPAFATVLAIAIGAAVVLAVLAALGVVTARADPLRRRVSGLIKSEDAPASTPGFSSVLRPFAPYLLPRQEKERESLRLKLIRAGLPSDAAAINLYGLKILLIVVFPAAVVSWLIWVEPVRPLLIPLFGFGAAFVGMMLPNLVLNHRVASRQREMLNALPDALDLLVSCTEAGLGLNGALQRVSQQLRISSPLLAHELEQVNAEIRGGVDRIVALRNLVQRTGLDELRGLVSLLSQSLRFGTPIAEILRIYAEEFRDKRTQKAEEQAALVGTKLIFPLCFCIFPAFFIVAVGPAVVGVIRAMTAADF